MSKSLRLVLRQAKAQTLVFVRTPRAAFFTLFFPLFFLFLFNSLNSGATIDTRGNEAFTQFFTPAIGVFAVISSCYTALAISLAMSRDAGILKRIRGTPMPPVLYMSARILSSVFIAVVSITVMFAMSAALYHFHVFARALPAAAVTILVGAACFCALGFAVSALAATGDSAPAVVNATLFPVLFISDIFFPLDTAPSWLRTVGWIFPIKHFSAALAGPGGAFDPRAQGGAWQWGHLGVMAAWTIAGLLVALRTFTWEPKVVAERRRGRRRAAVGA